MKNLVSNKKAFFEYNIQSELVAGLVLTGAETKSLKSGQASLAGSYVTIRGGEAFLTHAHITPYKYAGDKNGDPERDRKLLLTKKEISGLLGKEKGMNLIPIEIFQSRGLVKLKIGLGFSKKKYDKRETIKKKDIEKRVRAEM